MAAAKGGPLERLVSVALLTGLGLWELPGLTWDAVDFRHGTINANKQLARPEFRAVGLFISPKNGKGRMISPAPYAMSALKHQRARQAKVQL